MSSVTPLVEGSEGIQKLKSLVHDQAGRYDGCEAKTGEEMSYPSPVVVIAQSHILM